MRGFVLAAVLILAPAPAIAQEATPLQQLGIWGQQVVAVQQTAIDSYQACVPILQQVAEISKLPEAERRSAALRLLPPLRTCMSNMQASLIRVRDGFARMAPMPHAFEIQLHIDSKDILARSAAASEGMATYLGKTAEVLEALAAGDQATALAKQKEAREGAASVVDAQILMVETMRQGMPLETHKAMFDARLAMMRAMREIIISDPDDSDGTLSARLRKIGEDARSAAIQLRVNWQRESASLRSTVARLNSPPRTHMLAQMDQTFGSIADSSDEVATTLAALPPGRTEVATRMRIANQIAQIEARTLASIRDLGVAASQVH